MNTTKRTEISSLGEFGFVERLTKDIATVNKETVKGIGDDAAILQFGSDEEVLMTTDLFMEGVHFDLTYFPLKHLGYKVVVAKGHAIVREGINERFVIDPERFMAKLK